MTNENKSVAVEEHDISVNIDYKMVTFTLAGKDYGINIMNVASISKADRFTFVPNTAPFVRGVYNLRGEIISIIDLRLFFGLEVKPRKEKESENMVILQLEHGHLIGVIVDEIDRVVGVSSTRIQPSHPLFGDVNIEYIRGVVENENKLYIILDVEKIFSLNPDVVDKQIATIGSLNKKEVLSPVKEESIDLGFFKDTLSTFKKFHVSTVNLNWLKERAKIWKQYRNAEKKDFQLESLASADEFLLPFYSPHTGKFWDKSYVETIKNTLPKVTTGILQVWNPGCGKGYETYSLTCLLKEHYKDTQIKVHAGDSDLLSISSAPALNFSKADIPDIFSKYVIESINGYQFNTEIKDSIRFEYHDVSNTDHFAGYQLILARDIVSFLNEENQMKFFAAVSKKMKSGGVLILGENEELPDSGEWTSHSEGTLKFYIKK
ncbi:MAG: chemotaxis protein CheW [Spirochaetales bacterium]|nr:chemotaxis protein CheW [Spirochaetales bacterium]